MAKKYPKDTGAPDLENGSGLSRTSYRMMGSLQRYIWDIAGVFLLTSGLLTLLAMSDLTQGVVTTWWADLLQRWFGWGSYLFVPVAVGTGLILIVKRSDTLDNLRWGRILILELAVFAGLALLALAAESSLERASLGLDGGLIGWGRYRSIGMFRSLNFFPEK